MKVKLRNPDRVVEVSGPKNVLALLHQLDIVPEAVLVIRDATLLTRDETLGEDDELEVRPVLSGGSGEQLSPIWRRRSRSTCIGESDNTSQHGGLGKNGAGEQLSPIWRRRSRSTCIGESDR